MYCPKCGNQNPDGAAFCSVCGAQFSAPAAAPSPMQSAAGAGAFATAGGASSLIKSFSPVQIVGIVAAVLALIFSLLPWVSINSTYVSGSQLASQGSNIVSNLTGQNYTLPAFDENYSVFGFPSLASTIDSYKSIENSIKSAADSIASSSGRSRAVPLAEPQYSSGGPAVSLYATMVAWIVSVILILVGLFQTISSRGSKGSVILIAGSAILALTGLIWAFGLYPGLVSSYASSGGANNAVICGVLAIVCLVCSIMSRKATTA